MTKIDKKILKKTFKSTLFNQIICFGMLIVYIIEVNYLKMYAVSLVYILGMVLCYFREKGYFDF